MTFDMSGTVFLTCVKGWGMNLGRIHSLGNHSIKGISNLNDYYNKVFT